MPLMQHRAKLMPIIAGFVFLAALFALAQPAYAATRDELRDNYQSAVIKYESTVDQQSRNNSEIVKVEGLIANTERKISLTEEQIGDTAVSMYKGTRSNWVLDMLLDSDSFSDAVMRYEKYEKIEEYYREKTAELAKAREGLDIRKNRLEQRKAELELEVETAKRAAEEAEAALLDNMHTDGASFHQLQGTGVNCGATAFIVGVNTLLHENRFPDNVAVWSGPGFNGDSTSDIAYRGSIWLIDNGLFEQISIETVPGDIHTTAEMRSWLEQGYVIVTSSGAGSIWQRADGTQAPAGTFPDGHYIVFYCYDNGIYYANDSSVPAAQGAGCPYNEEQMQQWLDGRSNHFSVALNKR